MIIETSPAFKGECAFEQGYAELLYSAKTILLWFMSLSYIKNQKADTVSRWAIDNSWTSVDWRSSRISEQCTQRDCRYLHYRADGLWGARFRIPNPLLYCSDGLARVHRRAIANNADSRWPRLLGCGATDPDEVAATFLANFLVVASLTTAKNEIKSVR